jgi:myo-inositol-1(or 4)-monophosphatase
VARKKLPPRDLARILSTAIEAAHAAGAVLSKNFGGRLRISEKENSSSLVTQVDLAAESAALKRLKRGRPDFSILSEESAPLSTPAQARWIIDPLDGTTNYIHGFPMFCVSIGAEWEGELVAGVIYHPILKETYSATRGGGAFLDRKRLRVSKTQSLRNSLLTTGFTYRKDRWLHTEMKAFEHLSAVARAVRRPGSAALDLAYTARGVFDGFWERRLSPWDVAAGVLLVREAGGQVTDFKGQPYSIENRELLASNRKLHPDLLRAVSHP